MCVCVLGDFKKLRALCDCRKINILDVDSDFFSVLWMPADFFKQVNVEYESVSSAILYEVHDAFLCLLFCRCIMG